MGVKSKCSLDFFLFCQNNQTDDHGHSTTVISLVILMLWEVGRGNLHWGGAGGGGGGDKKERVFLQQALDTKVSMLLAAVVSGESWFHSLMVLLALCLCRIPCYAIV